MELRKLTASDLGRMIRKKEISVKEAVMMAFRTIEESEGRINALIHTDMEGALREAALIQRRIDEGEETGPLTGIPVTVKDNIAVRDMPMTCGSRILEGFRPEYDATAVAGLKKAGAVLIGKANMDEFAMGSSGEESYFGPVINPLDPRYISGGTSSGSAASVTAGECIASLGSDTGGSVRIPASFCGNVGLKPTYGSISRYGLVSHASSMDQIGPICKTVTDTELMFGAISGYDRKDSTSAPGSLRGILNAFMHSMPSPARGFERKRESGIKGLRVGIPIDYLDKVRDEQVSASFERFTEELRTAGADIVELSLGYADYIIAVYTCLASAEASSNLARYDGVKYGFRSPEYQDLREMYNKTLAQGFGPLVRERITIGRLSLHEEYDRYFIQAAKLRRLISDSLYEALKKADLVLTPTCPVTVPERGEKGRSLLKTGDTDLFTIPANLSGLPAMTMPGGTHDNGMPFGVQLMTAPWREDILFDTGRVIEELLK